MNKNDLKNIVISFERPQYATSTGFEFLQNPPKTQGGGLYDQVVMVKEELTFEDIVEFLFETGASIFTSSSIGEALVSMTSAVMTLAFNATSISLFPDEYKTILDFIEETKKGYALDSSKIKELIEKDKSTLLILDKLIEEKLLLKNKAGEYIVRKKELINVNISFIQIANKEN